MVGKCECWAYVSERDPRYEIWRKVDKDARIPLKHPLMHKDDKGRYFYEGDPERMTIIQWNLMARFLSDKFEIPKMGILRDLKKGILPVLATNITVQICNLHFRCLI